MDCRSTISAVAGIFIFTFVLSASAQALDEKKTHIRCEVLDADKRNHIPCRVYIQRESGEWFTVQSEAKEGSAVPYRKQRPEQADSVEIHTTLSAHPFVADLPPGMYTLTVERGKEYLPHVQKLNVRAEPMSVKVELRRWINMHERRWYCGDTHVHRELDELPNLMLAEDLNVAFPLLYWVRDAYVSPKEGRKGARDPDPRVISVDATHVIYPRNTEYEIFTVDKKRHTLGAFFVLNHQSIFDAGVPPVKAIAERAHKEGALLELDKHNWPWSLMLVPVMKIDLYELSNNHVWRTAFGFRSFGEPAPDYMKIEQNDKGFTEWGWIDYGFQNYYALLNCGLRLRPTAGTASGVHPVPLGFGRVYVHQPDGFNYDGWVRGLGTGNSFVTTGPMLFVRLNDKSPGHTFKQEPRAEEYRLTGSAESGRPLQRIEIIVNGAIVRTIKPANHQTREGGYESRLNERLPIDGSSWVAVRCFEDAPNKRIRFAHSSPFHVDVSGKPLQPRRAEVEFLIKGVEDQLKRNADVLKKESLDEYREALRIYQDLAKTAR
jgi:hypothetical protein